MEVINARSALLSNFEVLSLLREMEADYVAQTKTALKIKKEEESGKGIVPSGKHPTHVEISENLRTIEVEAIQYLSGEFQPTSKQNPEGITKLVKGLAKYELTKAEKLQVVNLAPTLPVELYVIVEELEDRLGQSMDEIITLVNSTLDTSNAPTANALPSTNLTYQTSVIPTVWTQEEEDVEAVDTIFDDTGEGVGVEGDLDMDMDEE